MSINRCPNCRKENTFAPWEGSDERFGVSFLARGERCGSCGETLYSFEELGRQDKLVALGIANRGIRNGKEFRFVRKATDLKATEVGELLDVTAETISRWENEKLAIPRYAAFIVGELVTHPKDTRRRLEQLVAR